jgi:hypothetical protein
MGLEPSDGASREPYRDCFDHHRPVDAARVNEGKTPMENAKHIGCMSALAVALGVGMAVANPPAVALAAPGDSGKGSSSGDSSPSSSSGNSGSTSSDTPSAKSAATNDAPSRHRLNPPGETAMSSSGGPQTNTTADSSGLALTTAVLTPSTSTSSTGRAGTRATPETSGTDPRQRGEARPGSGSTPVTTSANPAVVNAAAADPTVRDSSLDFSRVVEAGASSLASTTQSAAATPAALTAAPVSSTAAALAPPTPVSMVIAPTRADPVSRIVSTLINAVLSPFASPPPTAPVLPQADLILLAFARRESEQAVFNLSTVNPLAGQTTNGLVMDTGGSTSEDTSSAVDPGFISSTHNFGLFSTTSAADPDDNNFVAFVFESPIFTFVLTSGADPEDNLGFGAASTGVAGQTVGTFISPFLNFSIAIPIEDPFAELFTELVRLGF